MLVFPLASSKKRFHSGYIVFLFVCFWFINVYLFLQLACNSSKQEEADNMVTFSWASVTWSKQTHIMHSNYKNKRKFMFKLISCLSAPRMFSHQLLHHRICTLFHTTRVQTEKRNNVQYMYFVRTDIIPCWHTIIHLNERLSLLECSKANIFSLFMGCQLV